LLHSGGEEGEGDGHFAAVDAALQLGKAADAADEVDAFVSARVADATKKGTDLISGGYLADK
jgi:hypothetical protein